MVILRLEDIEGTGIYHSSLFSLYLSENFQSSYYHPLPYEDFGLEWFTEYGPENSLFGFDGHNNLIRWFDAEYFEEMDSYAIVLVKYDVPISQVTFSKSGRQVLFNKNFATKLETIELTSLI